jgi:hypothetical protein
LSEQATSGRRTDLPRSLARQVLHDQPVRGAPARRVAATTAAVAVRVAAEAARAFAAAAPAVALAVTVTPASVSGELDSQPAENRSNCPSARIYFKFFI